MDADPAFEGLIDDVVARRLDPGQRREPILEGD